MTSATYANTTENVTAKTPEIEIIAKYHQVLSCMSGIGAQVKKTVRRRNSLRPQTSERAPIRGADKNERSPCTQSEGNTLVNLLRDPYQS